ncbi:MAG: archease [Candidatus Omnitrophota bacterium]
MAHIIMKKYEFIEHTADFGLRVYGKNLTDLFINAAVGLFDNIAELRRVKSTKRIIIELKASNLEELFISWLRELLYQFSAKEIILKDFKIKKISDTKLEAEAFGEELDLGKHRLNKEIKAVTYHELSVKKINSGYQAQVIFDI